MVAPESNSQGQCVLTQAPVGVFKLMADGTTATVTGKKYPTLELDVTTVAGRSTTIGMPIYLKELDTVNQVCVSETTGGTLTLPASPGFSLTVAPGSATFPGGSRSGCISATPVNMDKVPMAPGFGQQPRFIVTIQPVGTTFNPPAAITIPNVDGLPPRAVTEMYSYDHDLASFVAIGTGTVSADGSVIRSDPGVGVLKAGWHCCGDSNSTGAGGTCPDCQSPGGAGGNCNGSCQPDNSHTPKEDCKKCDGKGNVVPDPAQDGWPAYSTPDQCCFQGTTIPNQNLSYNDLTKKCPHRQQNPDKPHESDGCTTSPVTVVNVQDPCAVFGSNSLAVKSTAFGHDEGTFPPGSSTPRYPLPCNWHDVCYQTCGSDKGTCDNNLAISAGRVCQAAYPMPGPYANNPNEDLIQDYINQRNACFDFANAYGAAVALGGFVAYDQRQSEYCNCCR